MRYKSHLWVPIKFHLLQTVLVSRMNVFWIKVSESVFSTGWVQTWLLLVITDGETNGQHCPFSAQIHCSAAQGSRTRLLPPPVQMPGDQGSVKGFVFLNHALRFSSHGWPLAIGAEPSVATPASASSAPYWLSARLAVGEPWAQFDKPVNTCTAPSSGAPQASQRKAGHRSLSSCPEFQKLWLPRK